MSDAPVPPSDVDEATDSGATPEVVDVVDPPDSAPEDAMPQTDAGDPNLVELRGACPIAERVGGFIVESQDEYSIVDGKVASGLVPSAIPELVSEDGGCRLLKRRNLFCDPPCGAGETCGETGACVPFPKQLDLGVVGISGLAKAVSMTPKPNGNNYFDTDFPHPAFTEDAIVTLSAPEAPLTLTALGVLDLGAFAPKWTLERDQPLDVTWPVDGASRSEVEVRMNVDQHGSSPVTLVCVFPDTGSAQIPSSLTNALLDAGISGYPNGRLSRRTADHAPWGAGCVDLVVGSPREAQVRVAGVTPCKKQTDCPSGQTCNNTIELCE